MARTCGHPGRLSPNSVRGYVTAVRGFLDWCQHHGHIDRYDERGLRSLLSQHPRGYGKQHGHYPGRWLTREEAFDVLVASCSDGTLVGLRDELVLRLGLAGVRVGEIRSFTVRHARQAPQLRWTGKRNKQRRATASPSLCDAFRRWLDAYAAGLARPRTGDEPLICHQRRPAVFGDGIAWGTPFADQKGLELLVARRARTVGLGHVAPHDLRRTAGGILHRAKTDSGGHHFDLLD